MSIAITPFTKQQLLPQEEKLRGSQKKKTIFLSVFQKKPVIKNAVFA